MPQVWESSARQYMRRHDKNIVINLKLHLERGTRIRNEERGSGTRNEDPEQGTRIRNEERGSGTRNEIPYDLV